MTSVSTPVRVQALATLTVLLVSIAAMFVPGDTGPGAADRPRSQPSGGDPAPAPTVTRPPQQSPEEQARRTATSFLEVYVAPDGRVVRHDEGGDTVSEGQAWALLLAVALDDEERADAIVEWTQEHLEGDDGLLAWRWADDDVVDPEPATDADLVWAWALSLGADRFGRPRWQVRAEDHADALADVAVATPAGPLLAAGPWAVGDPAVVNPSYLWPAALRWAESVAPGLEGTTEATRELLTRLVADDTPLVPDWVEVASDGTPTSIAGPGQDGEAQHGFDATRTWIWMASDCDPSWQQLAGAAADTLGVGAGDVEAVHALDGTATVDWQHAAIQAGAAATAHAAGDTAARDRLLERAHELGTAQPTYYGSAVTALAEMLLLTDAVSTCSETGG